MPVHVLPKQCSLWPRQYRVLLLLCASLWFLALAAHAASQPIKVGVADNPPIVFKDRPGHAAGIAIDVLEHVARRERWRVEYVYAPWAELLDRLEARELDLVVGIGSNETRRNQFRFTQEPLIGNWGMVYKAPGLPVTSLLDLKNRRVALMANSIHSDAFANTMRSFKIPFRPVFVKTYADVLEAITRGDADAGVVNRLFGNVHAQEYRADLTGIMFNPIYVHYATHTDGDKAVIDALDRYVRELKETPGSLYYRSLNRWVAGTMTPTIPTWLASMTIVLAILFSAALLGAGALRKQLRAHVMTLARRSDELRVETTQRRQAQEQLADAALRDPLTDLPNRKACAKELPKLLLEAAGSGVGLAVFFIDIDHFKGINQNLGHDVGDALLRAVTHRLQGCLHSRDKLFRFSGDEFALVVRGVRDDGDIAAFADHLLAQLREPADANGHRLYVTASIGVSHHPSDGRDPHELLRGADIAMRYAKTHGRNQYARYTPDMSQQIYSRFKLGTALRRAINDGGLSLHYQPIVKLDDMQPMAIEALLRWDDPTEGTRAPDEFIPCAEENGLIEPLGAWVLQAACTQTNELRTRIPVRVAVNVSVRQLESRKFVRTVIGALERSGLPPDALELEVTESVLLTTSRDVGAVLKTLKDVGVRFAIDDFGIGYSSLSYLTRLPIDTLKIDKTFVAGLPDATRQRQIVATILAMGRGLGLTVIAEGIETRAQLQALREQGCPYGQGYLIGRPLPRSEIEAWLREPSLSS